MQMSTDILTQISQLRSLAGNDNDMDAESCVVRTLATSQLTYTLAMFERDEGAP